MNYNIYSHGDEYELYIDGEFVDTFRTYREAMNCAVLRGATKTPTAPYNDEGAPF